MALLNINPSAIGQTLATTAGAKIAMKVAQAASPKLVQDVQSVLKIGNAAGSILGIRTGIDAIDGLLALGPGNDAPNPLLGGLSLMQAKSIYQQMQALRHARKNLFFLRIWDENPPAGAYQPQASNFSSGGLGGLFASKIGPAANAVVSGISGAVSSIAGRSAGNFVAGVANGALGSLGLDGGSSVAGAAMASFDLLAMDVSYGSSLISDHVQLGGAFMDRPTGRNPSEMQITTLDDEAGTLKRWFEGKMEQAVHTDGTFGLPWEYLVTIEVVHAIPSEQVDGWEGAYYKALRLRPEAVQVELSRRDQALMEHQFTFKQFDNFMGT